MIRHTIIFMAALSSPAMAESDSFGGDQLLYELSYHADYELSFVSKIVYACTGTSSPFIVADLPNPSFLVKQYVLGFRYGFVSANPYTGTRFPSTDDPRRPSYVAEIDAAEFIDQANRNALMDQVCDVFLWDAFEAYANAQFELSQYALEVLRQRDNNIDAEDFIEEVNPELVRLENLVNGDPRGSRDRSYTLD